MLKDIKKITKLKHIASFMQTNYIKGFKYIDKAGEIVNNYFDDGKQPVFQMNPNQLEIFLKTKNLKVSPKIFWINYNNPSSVESIFNDYKHEAQKIYGILGVSEFLKVGWRNHFIYEFTGENGKEDRNSIFEKINFNSELSFENGTFSMKENNINIVINISKVLLNEEKNNNPGVLFDIDLIKNISSISELNSTLLEMKSFLNGEKNLNIINSFLLKNDK